MFNIQNPFEKVSRALSMRLFLITLPQEKKKEGEPQKTEKEIIGVMEQFFASLANLKEKGLWASFTGEKPTVVFEIAIPSVGEEINFYIACPRKFAGVLEKTILGFYPKAQVELIEDYNIFNPEGAVCGSVLTLFRTPVLPLKTYLNLETDPLNEITNAMSKLAEIGEGAALQILIKPISQDWARKSLEIAKEMQKGESFESARARVSAWGKISASLNPRQRPKPGEPAPEPKPITPMMQEVIKAIESKAYKIGFEINIRILSSAPTEARTDEIQADLENAFAQFTAPNLNKFKIKRLTGRGLKKLIYNFSFRSFDSSQKIILNTEELAGIYHFPAIPLGTPKIKFLKAKQAPPPANLPKEGLILGKNIYRGEETLVKILDDDRRRHLYIVGQTGTGKSVFLQTMIRQDIEAGRGIGLIDPHGDLIESVMGLVPKERVDDVIVCDPSDLARPLGLNMLEYDPGHPEQKTFIVNELINIFDKLYDLHLTGGPIFEQYTRNALLLLMDDPKEQATLMEVPKVMADSEFRGRLLAKCKNIVVKDFWEKEAEKAGGEAALQNLTPYITSKFNTFVANDYMRPMIGQAKTTINFREILDSGKILLINLSKGRLGDINSSLLGLIIVGKIVMAAFSRVDLPQEERRDFYLYIDEFHNFTTESIYTILSEARKYRLCLTIAHQFIGQLQEKIRDAVFGNVGSLAVFRVGADDAKYLETQFDPVFSETDLVNIDNFNVYLKLLVRSQTTKPFNIQTFPPAKSNPDVVKICRELSRLKYGREREGVEEEIAKRWRGVERYL